MIEELDRSKKQVLVIDDSVMMLRIYERQFSHSLYLQDFQVSTCANAVKGFDWLTKFVTHHKALPQLIILDWMMPGAFDGMGLLMRIKKIDAYKKIPIIMVSCVEDKLKIIKAMKQGVDDYQMKPLNFQRLIKSVLKFTSNDPQVV